MTQDNIINRPPLSAWQTELMRLTIFPAPSVKVVDQNWWEAVVGEKPSKQNKDLRAIEQTDEGPFKDGRLILAATPLRIDWVYRTKEEEPDAPMTKLPVIGSFERTLTDFTDIIIPWFSTKDLAISRLAMGCVLLQEVDNHPNGYNLVSSYLPFQLDAENISDFIYRINRKKQSQVVDGLVINRLSTWSAIALRTLRIIGTGNRFIQQDVVDPLYAARLELDINTSQDYQDNLPTEKLDDTFRELIDAGIEIATSGDQR